MLDKLDDVFAHKRLTMNKGIHGDIGEEVKERIHQSIKHAAKKSPLFWLEWLAIDHCFAKAILIEVSPLLWGQFGPDRELEPDLADARPEYPLVLVALHEDLHFLPSLSDTRSRHSRSGPAILR